uniref:Uncharacterized protein n=1 Tax=viral metagenome TaxID=1070528 RepID=A0A6M3KH61_9ZZZZ
MAVTSTISNHFKFQLVSGNIDLDADTIQMALVSGEFTFDKDTHATWANVSSYELPNGVGYATGGIVMTGVSVEEDDVNDRVNITWDNTRWNASGEFGPIIAGVIYDNTSSDDTILGCIEFGEASLLSSGTYLEVQNVVLRLT